MKKGLFLVLALVLLFSFTFGASADPKKKVFPSCEDEYSGFINVTNLTPGVVKFNCGWLNSELLGTITSYWVRVYNVSDSTSVYEQLVEFDEATTAPEAMNLRLVTELDGHSDYKIGFWVRCEGYGTGWYPIHSTLLLYEP